MGNGSRQHDEEAFGELLRSLGPDTTPPPEFEQQLRQRLTYWIDALPAGAGQRGGRSRARIWVFRAAALAAALALAVGIIDCFIGGGVATAAADFANVLRQVRNARWVTYDQVVRLPGEPEVRARVFMSHPGRMRVEWPHGKIHIVDHGAGKALRLSTITRMAATTNLSDGGGYGDALDELQRVEDSAGRLVGTETVDSRQTLVYDVAQPQGAMRVLVDAETELPVRIEITTETANGAPATMILENFTWNQPIPDAMFSLAVPQGYTLEGVPSEGSLVDLLRTCANLHNGVFPAQLDAQTVFDLVVDGPGKMISADGIPSLNKTDDQMEKKVRSCHRGLAFIDGVNANGSWRYVGGGIRLGDGATPVCWWQPAGSNIFRVVYGDLQVKDLAPGELPGATRRDDENGQE